MRLSTFGTVSGTILSFGAGALTQVPEYQWLALPMAVAAGMVWVILLIIFVVRNRKAIKERVRLVEPWHVIISGLLLASGGILWQLYRTPQLRNQQIQEATGPLKIEIAHLQNSLAEARQQRQASTRSVPSTTTATPLVPSVTTAPVDIPRKLEAIDALRAMLMNDVDPWLAKSNQLAATTWLSWAVAKEVPQLKQAARDFWHSAQEIEQKLGELQKKNEQFPDIKALCQSPIGRPFFLKVQNLITPLLSMPEDISGQIEFYRFALEPAAKQASDAVAEIQQWRGLTDQKALALRQQISK